MWVTTTIKQNDLKPVSTSPLWGLWDDGNYSRHPSSPEQDSAVAAPGLAAPETSQRKATPSVPGKGESVTLALTPKKKRRHGGDFVTDNMPALNLTGSGPKAIPASQNPTRGLANSLFSGPKEATATDPSEKSRTRNQNRGSSRRDKRKTESKQHVLITAATAIDACLARYTTKHFLAAAELVRVALTAALENLISPPDETTGASKTPKIGQP
ncbi:hypothetical protein TGAMA5MH_11071 [Trichoderma gamsii]|uniref:Uncharacterized protein n=1 Tax=Trichoderma gamsii TaxID=398673 RepID=A0A2K0SUS7_9HYPO|nr:hypothetical protein TGAMA5MH_11071 [Trichoderma gamsii]